MSFLINSFWYASANPYDIAKVLLQSQATNAAMYVAAPAYAAVNSDGSGVISNGSAVGFWRDYVEGTKTLTQATAGKKPVALNNSGVWAWQSDGSDDVLTGVPDPTLSTGLLVVWAGRITQTGDHALRLSGGSGPTREVYIAQVSANAISCGFTAQGWDQVGVTSPIGESVVIAVRLAAGAIQARVNSGTWTQAGHGQTYDGTALTPRIGAGNEYGNFIAGQHSAFICANLGANATDANVRILEEAAARAAGVTLL